MAIEHARTTYSSTSSSTRTSKPAPKVSTADLEKAIQEKAYHLWEKAGRPHGRDVEFWLKAKKELQG